MSELESLQNQQSQAAMGAEISEDALNQEFTVSDPTRDINIPIEPPPSGVYPFLWGLNSTKKDGGAYYKQSAGGQWMLIVSLLGKLQGAEETDFENFIVSDTLNSFMRKGTTAIHWFMNCVGNPIPASTNLLNMKSTVVEVLGQQVTGYAHLEWKASYQRDGKWVDLAKRMTDFPQLKDEEGNVVEGKYQPWIEIENEQGEPTKIYAQAQIIAHVLPPTT